MAGLWTSDSADCAIMRYDQSGTLDASFGIDKNGMVVTPVSIKYNYFVDCCIQPDGNILAIGVSRGSETDKDEFLIVRYLPDGSLDHSFGVNGIVIMPVGNSHAHPKNILIQKDGKIVVTGHAMWGEYKKFTVIRYNADGSIDTSFGPENNGILVTSIGDFDDRSFALALQNDEKLIIVGDSFDGDKYDFALVRYGLQ